MTPCAACRLPDDYLEDGVCSGCAWQVLAAKRLRRAKRVRQRPDAVPCIAVRREPQPAVNQVRA